MKMPSQNGDIAVADIWKQIVCSFRTVYWLFAKSLTTAWPFFWRHLGDILQSLWWRHKLTPMTLIIFFAPLGGCPNFRQKLLITFCWATNSLWYINFIFNKWKTLFFGQMLPFLAKKYPYTPVADEFLVLLWGEGNTLATQCRYRGSWTFPS